MLEKIIICRYVWIPRIFIDYALIIWLSIVIPPFYLPLSPSLGIASSKGSILLCSCVLFSLPYFLTVFCIFRKEKNILIAANRSHGRRFALSAATEAVWYVFPIIVFLINWYFSLEIYLIPFFLILILYSVFMFGLIGSTNSNTIKKHLKYNDYMTKSHNEWGSLAVKPWQRPATWIWMFLFTTFLIGLPFCPDGTWASWILCLICGTGVLLMRCIGRGLSGCHPWHPRRWYCIFGSTVILSVGTQGLFWFISNLNRYSTFLFLIPGLFFSFRDPLFWEKDSRKISRVLSSK